MTARRPLDTGQTRGCILLFGMPRSGTTWLGKLFDSRPDTLYRHEPDSSRLLPMPRYPDAAEGRRHTTLLQSFVTEMAAINALEVSGKLPLFPKSYLSRPHAYGFRGATWLAHLGNQFGARIPLPAQKVAGDDFEGPVVWKSIESLGRTGAVLDALPHATGVHILRHPCGYIASVLRGQQGKKFSDNAPVSEDHEILNAAIGTRLGDSCGLSRQSLSNTTPEERLAWRWVLTNAKALREGGLSNRMLVMRYEDVCREPMARLEQMFEFTGLCVTRQTRAFMAASTAQTKEGYYSIYKDPLVAARRWQQELDADTIDHVMTIVRGSPLADYYDTDPATWSTAS